MPLYAVICYDKPDHLQVRLNTRDAHLAHIKDSGVVVQAGPFLNESGQMCGSLLILDVKDAEAAMDWARRDPYGKAGLFNNVSVMQWNKVLG